MEPVHSLIELTLRELGGHWRVLSGKRISSDLRFKRAILML